MIVRYGRRRRRSATTSGYLLCISIFLVFLNFNASVSRSINIPTSIRDDDNVIESGVQSPLPTSTSASFLSHQPPSYPHHRYQAQLYPSNSELWNASSWFSPSKSSLLYRQLNQTALEEQAAGTVSRAANIVDLVICILSVVGAMTIIFPFIFNKHSRKLRHALIVGLATSDLVASLIIIISSSFLVDGGNLTTAARFCDFLGYSLATSIFTQHLWNLGIALVTYMLLVHPLSSFTLTTERRLRYLWPIFWAFALIVNGIAFAFVGMSNVGGYCSFTPFGNNLFSPLIQFIPRAVVVVVTVILYTHLFFFLRRTNLFSAVTSKTATHGIGNREGESERSRESPHSEGSGGSGRSSSKQGGALESSKDEDLNINLEPNEATEAIPQLTDGDSTLIQRRAQTRPKSSHAHAKACSCGCSNCVNSASGTEIVGSGTRTFQGRRKPSFSTIKTLPYKLMSSFSRHPSVSSSDESAQQKCICICQPQVHPMSDQDQTRPPLLTMVTISSEPEHEDQGSLSSNLHLVQWQSGHGYHSRRTSDENGRRKDGQELRKEKMANEDRLSEAKPRDSPRKQYSGLKPLFTQPFAKGSDLNGPGKEMEMVSFPNSSSRGEGISPHQTLDESPSPKNVLTADESSQLPELPKEPSEGNNFKPDGAESELFAVRDRKKMSRLGTADGTYSSFGGEGSDAGSQQISSRRGKFPIPLKIKRPHTSGGGTGPSTSFASPIERIGGAFVGSVPASPSRKSSARLFPVNGSASASGCFRTRNFSETFASRKEGLSEGGILNPSSGIGAAVPPTARTWRGPVDWFDVVDPVRSLGLEDESDEDGRRFPPEASDYGSDEEVKSDCLPPHRRRFSPRRQASQAMSPRTDTRDFNMTSPPQEHLHHFLTNASSRKKSSKSLSRPASKEGQFSVNGAGAVSSSRRPSATSGISKSLTNATSDTSLSKLVEAHKKQEVPALASHGLPASVGATLSIEDVQVLEQDAQFTPLALRTSKSSEADHDFERGLGSDFAWGSRIQEGADIKVNLESDQAEREDDQQFAGARQSSGGGILSNGSSNNIGTGSRRGSATTFAVKSTHANHQTASRNRSVGTQGTNQLGTYGTSSYGSDDPHGVESLGSTLNKQASLLMLLYPAAYCLLFSVSIIRIIDDLAATNPSASRNSDALHTISRWFIFAQGALDAIIFQFIERHFRQRLKRRRRRALGEVVAEPWPFRVFSWSRTQITNILLGRELSR